MLKLIDIGVEKPFIMKARHIQKCVHQFLYVFTIHIMNYGLTFPVIYPLLPNEKY